MKANEVPDRLYISDSELNDAEHCVIWFKSQQNENDIEYIRKDAFIKKACKWLVKNLQGIVGGSVYFADFKKYMNEDS